MKKQLLLLLFTLTAAISLAAQRTRTERLMEEMRDPKSKYVFVASHRGDWRNWPENSIEAMQSAIEMGVDIVEIDVAMTSDSVLIVMHDRRADRTTKAKGLVSDLKWTDLSKFRLRSGHGVTTKCRIPTLEELLKTCKDKVLVNIDANGWPYPVTDVIDTYIYRALTTLNNTGMGTAAGLYQSLIGFILVMIANRVVSKINPDAALF